MKRLINGIQHSYYNFLMELALWRIKSHIADDKIRYWVKMLCKYAVKTVEI